jgi:hypothetical protein
LVVLQVILPRASFLGHLAGIVVGFAWYWQWTMPPIEWIQPCVLFPILWMLGRRSLRIITKSSSTSSSTSSSSSGRDQTPDILKRFLPRILTLHWMALVYYFHIRTGIGRLSSNSNISSLVISEGLILVLTYHFDIFQVPHAVVGLITTVWMTDSMTLAGWLLTRSLWWSSSSSSFSMAMVLMMLRWILWFCLLVVTCYYSNTTNESMATSMLTSTVSDHQGRSGTLTTNSSTNSSAGSGVGSVLQWAIIEPCYGLGNGLDDWHMARRHAKEKANNNCSSDTVAITETEALTSHVI